MRYDILMRLRPRFNDSKKTQKRGKILLSQTSKTGTNRSFRCFSPTWRSHQRCRVSVTPRANMSLKPCKHWL